MLTGEREINARSTGGIEVRLVLADALIPGEKSELWLTVDSGENHRAVQLDPMDSKDAFEHPMLYVEDPHEFS